MKKQLTRRISVFAALAFLALALLAIGFLTAESSEAKKQETCVSLSAEEVAKIVIASADGSDFSLYFSSDAVQADQTLASEIESKVRELYGIRLRPRADIAAKPAANEILIGSTNRSESAQFLEQLKASVAKENDLAWGFAVINGKLLYTANSVEAFNYGSKAFLLYLEENDFAVPSDLLVINTKTREEYDAEIEEQKRLEREEIIAALVEKNSAFTQAQFGGAPRDMYTGESPYNPPVLYPAEGVHPRLFITPDKLDDVQKIMNDPAYAPLVKYFWEEVALEGCIDGFPTVEYKDPDNKYSNEFGEDWYRYDISIISALQNKAFAYLLTGDVIYGYEAIIGAKNMILTLAYSTYIHMDMYHGPSHIMIAVAKIYDWCYDLMTEEDKQQIIAGVSNVLAPKMEMQFPPSGMNAVSGHGTGPQFLRDYFMVSVAFYDEIPNWWEFVGGRYFQYYVPVVDKSTENGWVSQGTACYGPGKFYDLIISFRLIYLASGQYSYDPEGLQLAPYNVISHLQPNGKYFQTGDGGRNPNGGTVEAHYLYDIAATFGDPVLTAYLYSITSNMNKAADRGWGTDLPAAKVLAYLAYLPEPVEDPWAHIDPIQYFEHPAGTMTARESWAEDAAAVYMKIGTMTMANHDIYDHGTFQIYYKGLLAGTSGTYNKYGSNVHRYYLQSTVSNNGILVFNPAYAEETPKLSDPTDPLSVTNGATYYYSGSQRRRNEAGSIENWLSGEYVMGEITGYASAYRYEDGSPEYGYIAGDIASSYDSSTVNYLERRMLTVFTGDETYPMIFFTFDTIESVKDSFAKSWLLHTIKEPEVDTEAMTADIRAGEGRLFVQSLFGADSMTKIGGEGKAYWINGYYKEDGTYVEGKNCVDSYAPNDNYKTFWGRVQIDVTGQKQSQLLTAMAVTDASNEATIAFEKFESESVFGAVWGDIYTVFLKSRDRQYKEFTFETSGTGLSKYYISGIESGTWKVLVDGVAVATIAVDEDGGFASFIAPSGKVTFKPTENVVGTNGGKIQYVTLGGILGQDIKYSYRNETDTLISTDITRGSDKFCGWYTTPSYEDGTNITHIPAGTTGTVKLYAKWLSTFIDEDYSETTLDLNENSMSKNGISYNGSSKTGASFVTKTDENGINYLEWIEGTKDPMITVTSVAGKSIANMGTDDETVSYELSIARNGDAPIMPFSYRIMSNLSYGAKVDRVWGELVIFSGTADGTIRLGRNGPVIGNIADSKIFNIRVAVDFANCKLIAYDKNGAEMQSMTFTVPSGSGAPDGIEWRKLMSQYIAYFYAEGAADLGGALRVYKHKIAESNILANPDIANIAIKYETNGGTLASDAPFYYTPGEITPLPSIYKPGAVFGGWYSSPDYDSESLVTEIPADWEGPFNAYAKWDMTFINTDFAGSNLNGSSSSNASHAGIDFVTNGKTGASAVTKTDENGKTYIEFITGTSDPIIRVINEQENFSTMAGSVVSYSFKFRKKAGSTTPISNEITLESNVDVNGAGKWGALKLLRTYADGTVVSGVDNSVVVGNITEDSITEINFVIDFKYGKITYYDANDTVIATVFFSAPANSGASSTAEWQRLIKKYMFYMRMPNNAADSALMVYGMTIKEGNMFSNALPTQNDIIYDLGGGILPSDVPMQYDPENGTTLPIPTKENATFEGWYTSPTFDKATRVEKISAGTEGAFLVYAKWNMTFVDVDFEGTNITGATSIGSFFFNGKADLGASFTSKVDENGKTYVEWVKGNTDSLMGIKDTKNNFSTMTGTAASYSFKFRKNPDAPLLHNLQIILESDKKMDGSSSWQSVPLFQIKENGDIVAGVNNNAVIATITEDAVVELNFTIDFAQSKIIYYDTEGKAIVAFDFTPPVNSGATTALQWQKLIQQYMFYCRAGDATLDPSSSLLIYGVSVKEGCTWGEYEGGAEYIPPEPVYPDNAIIYNTNGGTLPADTPEEYDPAAETVLPVPEKNNATFLGWYTSNTFNADTRVEKTPLGGDKTFFVYAKWSQTFVDASFEGKDVKHGANIGGLYIGGSAAADSSFSAQVDENGETYLEWVKGSKDTLISVKNTTDNFSTMGDTAASYSFKFRKKADTPILHRLQVVLESDKKMDGTTSWQSIRLFNITKDGYIISGINTDIVIAQITEDKITELNFVIDFAKSKIIYYGEDGNAKVAVDFTPPVNSGATTALEWQKLITQYMLYCRAEDNSIDPASALLIYSASIVSGNVWGEYDGSADYIPPCDVHTDADTNGICDICGADVPLPDPNEITYNVNGGTLPEGATEKYDPEVQSDLPVPTKSNSTFLGWYTTKTFDAGTRVEKTPLGGTEPFAIYAKWSTVFVDTDFAGSNLNGSSDASVGYGGFEFGINGKPGASAVTKTDEDGKTYVEWVKGSSDSLVRVKNTSNNFSTMTDTAASYSFKLRKKAGAPLITNLSIVLESDKNMSGSTAWAPLYLFQINDDGSITSMIQPGVVIATVTEDEITELNFVIDFAASKIIHYGKDGNASVAFDFAPPAKSGASTALEWQKLLQQYMFYARAADASNDPESALLFYGVSIISGNKWGEYDGSADYVPPCDVHTDADTNGICDVCGAEMPAAPECTEHVDANADGKCDVCEADVPAEPECTEHVDANADGKCDVCEADTPITEPIEPPVNPDENETPEVPEA